MTNHNDEKGLLQKADIINLTILIFVGLISAMAAVHLWLALYPPNGVSPLSVLADLRDWLLPLVSGVFLAYGLSRKINSQ